MKLRKGKEVAQTTQLIEIPGERQPPRAACRGFHQRPKGFTEGRDYLQLYGDGSLKQDQQVGGRRAVSRQISREVNTQSSAEMKEAIGVTREEGLWVGNGRGGGQGSGLQIPGWGLSLWDELFQAS